MTPPAALDDKSERKNDVDAVNDGNNGTTLWLNHTTPACAEVALHRLLDSFGKGIRTVFVNQKKGYALVAMKTAHDAQQALEEIVTPHELFRTMTMARSKKKKRKQAKKRPRSEQDHSKLIQMIEESNVVYQVSKSHVDRFVEWVVHETNCPVQVVVVGQCPSSVSKKVSLVFLKLMQTRITTTKMQETLDSFSLLLQQFDDFLVSTWYMEHDSHRTYSKNRMLLQPNNNDAGLKERAPETDPDRATMIRLVQQMITGLCDSIDSCRSEKSRIPIVVRLKVFPPRLQSQLLTHLEQELQSRYEDGNDPTTTKMNHRIEFSPTQFDLMLEVVQVTPMRTAGNSLFTIGVRRAAAVAANHAVFPPKRPLLQDTTVPPTFSDKKQRTENDVQQRQQEVKPPLRICRAYGKLREALDRYPYQLPDQVVTALDCGAAPGGWTAYLAHKYESQIKTIHSVDPAELDPSVLKLEQVVHIPSMIQDALPRLGLELADREKLNMYVSDMCVKEMEMQVTHLLHAHMAGIVDSNTFFVLTLKCTMGHSAKAYDTMVAQQIHRLEESAGLRGTYVVHLFTNRPSERTVMGYLNPKTKGSHPTESP